MTCQGEPPNAEKRAAAATTSLRRSGRSGGTDTNPLPGLADHAGHGEVRRGPRSMTTAGPAAANSLATKPATVERPLPPVPGDITGTTRRAPSGRDGTAA